MRIEVWSDFVCPFCYIGKRRLEMALNEFEHKEEVELVFKSFELDPQSKKKFDESIHEIIANKYGIPVKQAKAMNDQIVAQAREIGLNYNFDDMKPTNTFDAHRLSHYAKAEGKMNELSERILKAYFVESMNISGYEVLSKLAEEVGLNRAKALEVLETGKYSAEVRNDEEEASKLNITGVPYFVFNGKYAVSGAQPIEVFLRTLNEVIKEEKSGSIQSSENAKDHKKSVSGKCVDGKCEI